VFPHYILKGRHRNPAVPIKAMRCNARMALIVLEIERVHFNLRNWTTAMPPDEEGFISGVAIRHSVTPDAVRTILRALRSGGGTMAQFSHADFGGMSQWSPGMTMVGDMFNNALKSKLDALCTELAAYVAQSAPADQRGREDMAVSYRAARQGTDWWPANLGSPSAVGAQNDLEYAVFPNSRRLVIKDSGRIDIYDTGDHRIFGVAQAQSADQTLTFTSQDGLVRVKDLPKVGAES
jgi:hypothetical protein